jgi:tight adherence protein B
MNLTFLGIGILIFCTSITIIELLRYSYRHLDAVKRAKVRRRIKKYTFTQRSTKDVEIVKKRIYSEVPFLNRLLGGIFFIRALDQLTVQANTRLPIGFFLLLSLALSSSGFWAASVLAHHQLLAVLVAMVGLLLPFAYLVNQKQKRIKRFREQLPEGLDLIARSLRAGHAFTSGMKLAADEFPEPLGAEFQEVIEEINYGVSTQQALKGLARRVDCPEVHYFVVAVILQRETGGNLAELLEGLARLMREKVKFDGKVRTLAAEGKITAVILVLTPFLVALYLELNTPGYLSIFLTHPMGRMMMFGCSALMVAGIVVLRRMVDIKV